jgi:formylglycine-generating enzyme required for sulfatase activity
MKLKIIFAAAVLSVSLVPVAQAADQGPTIQMVAIPGMNYEMGKYEVTQGQWTAVMGNNPSYSSDCGDNCPVEKVSWDDIQVFLQKLNAKTGKQYRLPSKDEWEIACRGDSEGEVEYCGGGDLNALGWYKDNSGYKIHPVGFKKPNGYGLYDMSGNVWEWSNEKFEAGKPDREVRGGSWDSGAERARAGTSLRGVPAFRNISLGFRLARTLP